MCYNVRPLKEIEMTKKARCQTKQPHYLIDEYGPSLLASEEQFKILWPASEIDVQSDLHCMKTELTESEYHGVMQVLPLFTKTELVVGNEYWNGRFKRMFPRPVFQDTASMFGMVEVCIHARFYSEIDRVLGLNNKEFYESFAEDPVLAKRSEFIDSMVADKSDALSIAVFSMIEGSVLYSAFAFMMHFQANTKNKIPKTVGGITFSVKDENLHSEFGSWVFRTLKQEQQDLGIYDESVEQKIYEAAQAIYENEVGINNNIFAKGDIAGYKKEDANEFMRSRINLCLQNLGLNPLFDDISDNPIAEWFYKALGGETSHDFFVSTLGSYNRDWSQEKFTWKIAE